jgi:UDP-N-acetylmuramoylalanine--D-glutamate ligase
VSGYAGKKVTIWGLGSFGGGVAATRYLARAGAAVTVTDLRQAEQLEASLRALEGEAVAAYVLGEHREEDLLQADLVVKSPAIPPSAEWLARIEAAGVPVTAEIVLGLERVGVPFAGVTGSKGKTTTASLMGAMAGAEVVGNNERPLLDASPEAPRLVLEVSSFMADAVARARARGQAFSTPEVVVLTSLEPEHLNWHGDVDAYYAAKLSLLELGPKRVVFPAADPELAARVPGLAGEGARLCRTWVGEAGQARPGDLVAADGVVRVVEGPELFRLDDLQVLGDHNLANALGAAAGALALGAEPEAIRQAAAAFTPLPHRLETVARAADGTRYVNDSTATTLNAAMASMRAAPPPVVLLAGGADKGADYRELGRAAAALHAVVCLGKVGPQVADGAEAAVAEGAGQAQVVRATSTFEDAFARARALCPPGGTVLLAPGTASYGMFLNFKERGERVRALAEEACRGL